MKNSIHVTIYTKKLFLLYNRQLQKTRTDFRKILKNVVNQQKNAIDLYGNGL